MDIAVIALGKIGLPLAVQFASKGHSVTGVDIDVRCVETVNSGRVPFPGEADLDTKLEAVVSEGQLTATADYAAAIPRAKAIVLVVPLLVDETTGAPDFKWMDAAVTSLAEHLTPDTLVVFETTLPVGTTRNRWKPMIERISGLVEGVDFFLTFSPERVLTGRVFADLRRYPKLFGSLTVEGAGRTFDFYQSVLDFDARPDLHQPNGVWDLGSPEAAELAKLAETTYRDVNIGLANQFALHAEQVGVDIYKVIEASNSQPYSHIHQPGVAVGGHCIPVYPRLYLSGDGEATVVSAARAANERMPRHTVELLARNFDDGIEGKRVGVLGAAYRGGVKETAVSGVFPLVEDLTARGAVALVHDPMFTRDELSAMDLTPFNLGESVDAVILHSNHEEYLELRPSDFPGLTAIVDGRNFLRAEDWSGVAFATIGNGAVSR